MSGLARTGPPFVGGWQLTVVAGAWQSDVVALRTTTTWWGVVLDTPDVARLARFYADLLGWQIFGHPFCLYLDPSANASTKD